MASYYIEGPAVLWIGASDCNAKQYKGVAQGGWTEGESPNQIVHATAELLGITESGVTISNRLMTHRISTDDYGGPEGPPAELLILGATASLQGVLVKWGEKGYGLLKSGLRSVKEGQAPWPGHGVYGGEHAFGIWVIGSKYAYYFPKCELATQPREWNISALERRMNLNITAIAANIFGDGTTGAGGKGSPHIFYRTNSTGSEPQINKLFPSC